MTTEARATFFDWAMLAGLAAMALAPVIMEGNSDFTFSDASRHAMDGVFVLDAAREMPLRHPMEWAKRYYLTSPALGMGRYPPLLAVIQTPFYAALGVHPFAARLAGAVIWLAGLIFFYELARMWGGRMAAAIAAGALAAGPASVRWGGEVMLELPATAFLIAGACLYARYLANRRRANLTGALVLICLAGWIKQPAAALVGVVLLHFFLRSRSGAFRARDILPGTIWAAALLAPLAALSFAFGRANISLIGGGAPSFPFASPENWLYYVTQIPRWYLGWPLTVLSGVGIIASISGRGGNGALFFGLWAGAFYLFFSAVGYKTARLAMFWTPALAFFAGTACAFISRKGRFAQYAAGFICAAAVLFTFERGLLELPRQGAAIYTAAEKALKLSPKIIFYVGEENGTFIFRVREIAGRERPIVIRDSKILYTDIIQRELGRIEPSWTQGSLRKAVARISPDVVVVERATAVDPDEPRGVRLFREYLRTTDFELTESVRRGAPDRRGTTACSFEVYLYRGPRTPEKIDIQMPGVGMELQLDTRGT